MGKKADLFWNSLEAPALDLLFDNGNTMMNYKDVTYMMEDEFYSIVWKATVQAEIKRLLLLTLLRENEIYSLPEGIKKINDRIYVLTPHDPLPFRDMQHKIKISAFYSYYLPFTNR